MLMSKQDIHVDTLYVNGCSWTYGSELLDPAIQPPGDHFQPRHDQWRQSHAWAYKLAKILDLACENGSIAGSSNSRILRTTIQDLARLRSQGLRPMAVIAWTGLSRFELNDGTHWQQFVGPEDRDRLPFIEEMMGKWWHDSALIEAWCIQASSLSSICQQIQVPLYMTFTFDRSQYMFSDLLRHRKNVDLISLVRDTVQPELHSFNASMQATLRPFGDQVSYGPGGHPLEQGHEILAQWYRRELYARFNFIT